MRAKGSALRPEETVTVSFDGRTVPARRGESIAAALVAAGTLRFRTTREGAARGPFCGMGVCHECLVEVDGVPNVRACMTKVSGAHEIRTQTIPARIGAARAAASPGSTAPRDIDVLVVGGGAAGLTAASVAAEAGARVALVDERPTAGGQFLKQPAIPALVSLSTDDSQFRQGRALLDRAQRTGVVKIDGAVVAAAAEPLAVMVSTGSALIEVAPGALVVATGAYERPLPVAGWTLPGVMTTGAAQTLLRSYRVLAGRRILIAGNGPLNLQVAVELAEAGAQVVAVAELAPRPGPKVSGALLEMARTAPQLLAKGAGYVARLYRLGIPLHHATLLADVRPGLEATLARADGTTVGAFAADAVCMGYGFHPSNELLRLLGCRQDWDARHCQLTTVRTAEGLTSVPRVFAAGDCCGLNGAQVAMAEGVIAGLAAAQTATGRTPSSILLRERTAAVATAQRHRRFQSALWTVFHGEVPDGIVRETSTVCRCEDLALGDVERVRAGGDAFIGSVKRQTRLGMGRCQGRYCVPLAAERLSAEAGEPCSERWFAAPRPPLRPTPIATLARPVEPDPNEQEPAA
ncbi:MAG: FAD-dependent oxidoreductase [Hyphomicrobiales bacterium]